MVSSFLVRFAKGDETRRSDGFAISRAKLFPLPTKKKSKKNRTEARYSDRRMSTVLLQRESQTVS